MHGRPDVVEELNLNDWFQTARRHADSTADNICFSQRRIEDSRTAKLSLQVGRDLEHATLAFDVVEILVTRTVSNVFAEDNDAWVAGHFGGQAAVDQVDPCAS